MHEDDFFALMALVGIVGLFVVLFVYLPVWVGLVTLFGLLVIVGANA